MLGFALGKRVRVPCLRDELQEIGRLRDDGPLPIGHRHTRADQIQGGWSPAMSLYNLKLNHGADPAHQGAQLFAPPR